MRRKVIFTFQSVQIWLNSIFVFLTKIKGVSMSAFNDIKESKSFRLVLGFVLGVVFTQYFNQNQPLQYDITHSLSDDIKALLIANLNVQQPQALPATVVHCNQSNTVPNTRSSRMVTDEGMKTPDWKPPENPKQKPTNNTGVDESTDDKSTATIPEDEEEEFHEGDGQEEPEIVQEEIGPAAINWPGYNAGQIVPLETVNTSTGQVGSTTPTFPPASVNDTLPPEDSYTGSIEVVIQRPKKGS
jgi:hypothetical protein